MTSDAANRNWGYLAFEKGVLFGSVENQGHNVSAGINSPVCARNQDCCLRWIRTPAR